VFSDVGGGSGRQSPISARAKNANSPPLSGQQYLRPSGSGAPLDSLMTDSSCLSNIRRSSQSSAKGNVQFVQCEDPDEAVDSLPVAPQLSRCDTQRRALQWSAPRPSPSSSLQAKKAPSPFVFTVLVQRHENRNSRIQGHF
jgi:hypothetical protein